MKISKNGINLIKEFEGYHDELPDGRCQAYLDKLADPPVWTIGWGCTEGVKKGMVWTRKQAEEALMKEIRKHEENVKKHIKVDLNQNEFDALVSFSYNVGLSPKKTPTLINRVNARDWDGAAEAFLLYNKSGGKKRAGLVRRREAEKRLFETPTKDDIVESSRLLTTLRRIRTFIGTTVAGVFTADTLGVLKDWAVSLGDLMTNPWFLTFLGSLGVVWFLVKYVEFATVRAAEEGRYSPSKW